MMRGSALWIPLLLLTMVTGSMMLPAEADPQTIGGVPVGEPLHLWFKRSPTQDLTTLVFYPPKDNETVRSDLRFRHVFGPAWNETSSYTLYFPTAKESNFLQFEYNDTLKGNYSFVLSAVKPRNASNIDFRLKVTIDMDVKNDQNGKYDKSFVFTVNGKADSERRKYTGNIEIPKDLVRKFDGEKGGRLRVTIERDDDIDTNVVMYCGYGGFFSSMNLPYSKYRYVPSDGDGENEFPVIWVLVLGSLFIILVVFVANYLARREGEDRIEPSRDRRGRRKT